MDTENLPTYLDYNAGTPIRRVRDKLEMEVHEEEIVLRPLKKPRVRVGGRRLNTCTKTEKTLIYSKSSRRRNSSSGNGNKKCRSGNTKYFSSLLIR